MQKITPFLWFDNNAEEAVKLYTSLFPKAKILTTMRYDENSAKMSGKKPGSLMTVSFQLFGQDFGAINGGPIFHFTPGISFMVHCSTEKEVTNYYNVLVKGGEVMMPLDSYPFSKKYAFIKDKFGLSWQLFLSEAKSHITPSLLFVGKDLGKAEAAVKFYTQVFKGKVDHMLKYEKGEPGKQGTVKHASFVIEGQEFDAMDGTGPHKFTFNESLSFIVNCDTQKEIDLYWGKLSAVKESEQCGWLKDKFGISWQIIPSNIQDILAKNPKAMAKMLQMKKLNIKDLEQA